MSTNLNPVCPEDCSSLLPENTFDLCVQNLVTGEVDMIFLANSDAECFTDWTQPTEWINRISLDSADPDAIRQFRGIGDLPAGASDEIAISLGDKFYSEKTFTLNFDIEDVSDENYAFMRYLECNSIIKLWFRAGGYLFGGTCGVSISTNSNYVIERGQKTLHHIMLVLSWENHFSLERCVSPV